MRITLVSTLVATAFSLGACNSSRTESPVVAAAPAALAPVPAALAYSGPVLGPDGQCQGGATGTATAIEPGIGECDLVRLKGKTPTDVLVGESGKGQREVQVLYSEPGGRELYFFVNNRLDRVVK
ncbi:hypothetical protein [Microvirga puerhi]|uniref:Uncharacterized protein n=1 Tax=Microvirga puerhi TaxID=2876078 RepID=A0ABS7VR13_9HYPH|nr:hypothetical protein [Microvirga puerhi]MBZ6077960.1 hypothetical protein [Microvirga puerhi]